MIEALVGQFLQSGAGADVLNQLKGQGVEGEQAKAAVHATAEGAAQQLGGGAGGLGGLAAGLLGGGGGGLGGLAAGMLGGGAPAAGAPAGGLGAMAAPVAQFVAQKTGLSPAIAQAVVNAALPKLLELLKGGPTAPAGEAGGGLGGMLGGLLK